MAKQRLIKIERRKSLTRNEFDEIYLRLEQAKNDDLIPAQLPTGQLPIKIAKNVVTPESTPIPDCLTCGVCCNLALCVPVSPGDKTSAANFWKITAGENLPTVVIERFLRYREQTGSCASLNGEIKKEVACAIYETRPKTCREFEAGSDRCHAFRRMYGLEEPLSDEQLIAAKAKLENKPTGKITSVLIVPEEFESESFVMQRQPDQTFAAVMEKYVEVICRVFVYLNDEVPVEIHSYNPAEECWLQHQFMGLSLAEAQSLILGSKKS